MIVRAPPSNDAVIIVQSYLAREDPAAVAPALCPRPLPSEERLILIRTINPRDLDVCEARCPPLITDLVQGGTTVREVSIEANASH